MLGTIAFYITVNEGQRNKQTRWTTKSIGLQGCKAGYKVTRLHCRTVAQKKRQKRLTTQTE